MLNNRQCHLLSALASLTMLIFLLILGHNLFKPIVNSINMEWVEVYSGKYVQNCVCLVALRENFLHALLSFHVWRTPKQESLIYSIHFIYIIHFLWSDVHIHILYFYFLFVFDVLTWWHMRAGVSPLRSGSLAIHTHPSRRFQISDLPGLTQPLYTSKASNWNLAFYIWKHPRA